MCDSSPNISRITMQEERAEHEDKPAGEGQQVRWDTARRSYVCPDGVVVQVPRRSLVQREREDEDSAPSQDEHM